MKIAIIGAGIIGCLLAHHFAKQHEVTLWEQADIASATTGLSGGFICPATGDAATINHNLAYYQQLSIDVLPINCLLDELVLEPAAIIKPGDVCRQLIATSQLSLKLQHHIEHINHSDVSIYSKNQYYFYDKIIIAAGSGSKRLLAKSNLPHDFIENKAFQFVTLQGKQAVDAIYSKQHDFYLIPQADNRLIAGFLSRDITLELNQPTPRPCSALTAEIISWCRYYYPESDFELIASQMAVDAFVQSHSHNLQAHPMSQHILLATGGNGSGIKYGPNYLSRNTI